LGKQYLLAIAIFFGGGAEESSQSENKVFQFFGTKTKFISSSKIRKSVGWDESVKAI